MFTSGSKFCLVRVRVTDDVIMVRLYRTIYYVIEYLFLSGITEQQQYIIHKVGKSIYRYDVNVYIALIYDIYCIIAYNNHIGLYIDVSTAE